MVQIQSLKVLSQLDAYIMAMIYGRPGSGKTIAACGSQKMRTLLIDVDQGASSAICWRGTTFADGFTIPATRLDLIDRVPVRSKEEMIEAIALAEQQKNWYDLVVMDTGTEFQKM